MGRLGPSASCVWGEERAIQTITLYQDVHTNYTAYPHLLLTSLLPLRSRILIYTIPWRYRAGALGTRAGHAYLAIMVHALNGHCPVPFLQETLFPTVGGFIDGRYCKQVTLGNSTYSCCLPCPLAEWRYDTGMFL